MNAAAMAMIIFSCSITLNPDGSGKAVFEVRQSGGGGVPKGVPTPDLAKAAPSLTSQLGTAQMALMGTVGVDAWSDLSLSATPDGQVIFRGTAYFKNLERFHIHVPGAGARVMMWEKGAKSGGVLKFDAPAGSGMLPKPATLPPDELAKQVAETRARWKQGRFHEERTGQTVLDLSFKLPGEVAEVVGFKKEADGTVHIKMDGMKYEAAVDALLADDKALGNAIQLAGGEGLGSFGFGMLVLEEMLLGAKLPFTAAVRGEVKPPFDFAAEVKAIGQPAPAVAAQAEALVKQLGAAAAGQRDEAEKKLVDLARMQDIRDLLQKHADDADPEVVARVRRVLAAPDAAWMPETLTGRLKALAARAAAMEKERRDREKAREARQPPPAGETLEEARMRMAAEQATERAAAEQRRAAEKAAAEK
jgi:hypothetical protein